MIRYTSKIAIALFVSAASMASAGSLKTAEVPTERTVEVPAEYRTVEVPDEYRTVKVPAERTVEVPAEY